ncbi:FtsX-like permease family protein [Kribbella soli]|uniref:ABC transporter permease n=1 Tax=Kribbella soli TaxID=1124743 RepID=A0A4R0H810_9ACTN|nr:FtsX-like permease family protein [Kribbella soli]TCC05918.1 ABC transporter permease [Kribbella soli]
MFLRRALRYRWAQALVLTGVSLLIGTCAVFGPWFARAVEQTVMTETLAGQPLQASWLIVSQQPGVRPEQLDQLLPADLRPIFTPPVHGYYSDISWRVRADADANSTRLRWRDGYCAQLVVAEGRCPQSPNEVIVSAVDKSAWDLGVGTKLRTGLDDGSSGDLLTVVGLYRPKESRGNYWFGDYPTGHSRPPSAKDPGWADEMFTEQSTLTGNAKWSAQVTSDTRPIPGVARLDDLSRMQDATRTVNGNATEYGVPAEVTTSLTPLIDQIQADREQATTIIPLVMVQVALFAVVVLALALAAVVDQRRPEIALSRLRGSAAGRTHRKLTLELGLPVCVGTLLGGPVGFGVLTVVHLTWLRRGAPMELPWTVPVALVVAAVVALIVVAFQVRTAVRQPISDLLRRVAPRGRSRMIGVADLCIIVFAAAGLFAAITGDSRGPFPILTPALLALAVGLIFAHLLLPIAGLISRQAVRRGRLGLALGALQISRRPAVTRIVAAVAVAAALLTFAGQAAAVGARNRETRSGYETGAEGVLRTNGLYLADFLKTVDKIDPDRHWLTPVVIARPASPDALKSEMIEPDSFRKIAFRGDQLTDAEGWQLLKAPSNPAPIQIRSAQLTVTVSTGAIKAKVAKDTGGEQIGSGKPKSVVLRANVVSHRDGSRYLVSFPPLPLPATKPVELRTPVECQAGCDLIRLGIGREPLDPIGLEGDLVISKISSDDRPSIALGGPESWQPFRPIGSDQGSVAAKPGGALTIAMQSFGADQFLQYGTVPAVVPALVTQEFRYADGVTTSPAIDSTPMTLTRIDRLRAPVNRYGDRTAVVDLETVRRLGGAVDEVRTDFEVWLNKDGLANVDTITEQLAKAGLNAELVDRRDDRIASYGRSASALALQLTPVVGIAAWILAIVVLLLTVITSWRSRAQDYASLQLTGVPVSATGRAARWEQTGPVTLAVLLGTVCGLVGAQVALPLIPLFASNDGPVPLDHSTSWPVATALWLGGTAILAAATLFLGSGVNRRSSYRGIREELT